MSELLNCNDEGFCLTPGAETDVVLSSSKIHKMGTIWYFGDPMCSWCWGISDELSRVIDHYKDTLDFEMVMGGLRPGGGEEWNTEFKEFLRKHWNHVNMASGKEFSHDIFEREQFNYDTEPPSRAVVVVRFMYPEKAFDFLKKVSEKFYVQNQDPSEDEFYRGICEEMDIDYAAFKVLYHSQKFKQATFEDFRSAKEYGVLGFPTVLLEHKRRFTVITRGFNIAERLIDRIENVLEKTRQKEAERQING